MADTNYDECLNDNMMALLLNSDLRERDRLSNRSRGMG